MNHLTIEIYKKYSLIPIVQTQKDHFESLEDERWSVTLNKSTFKLCFEQKSLHINPKYKILTYFCQLRRLKLLTSP